MFLKTARTNMRPIVQTDLDKLSVLCSSPETMRYIPPHFSVESKAQIEERLAGYIRHDEEYGISFCYVSDKEGNFLGRAGFYFVPEVNLYEVGYSLLPQYWGQGYATEIVNALLDHAFNTLNLDAVCARTIKGNDNSEKVLHKTGFTYFGERAFAINNQLFIWNYYEHQNEHQLSAADHYETYSGDWDPFF